MRIPFPRRVEAPRTPERARVAAAPTPEARGGGSDIARRAARARRAALLRAVRRRIRIARAGAGTWRALRPAPAAASRVLIVLIVLIALAALRPAPAHANAAGNAPAPRAATRLGALAPPGSSIVTRTFRSATLQRDWSYTVYLPPGYRDDGPRHPVLYLLHGNAANANDWITQGRLQLTADALIARHEIAPVVIVMPQAGTDWYVDRKEPMQTAFLEDLLPDVEAHYAVSNQRAGRAIGGVSMGGYGALRFALMAPDRFCGALLLSPAIYADEPPPGSAARYVGVFGDHRFDPQVWHALNYPPLLRDYLAQAWRVPVFIAAGDDDLSIQAESSTLYTSLRRARSPAELRIVDGGHTWDVWRRLLAPALGYALDCVK
ncbi:esterase [Burkholderia plantarii]|uniref:Esterase n=1 Tax=Burkholderia plantarii TaxID=41899 RepID=A0A0B6S3Y8_BURPL|nr:esterase [Burkholderia plantarii]